MSADSSENVLIERCTISCGDDHIAIKSGLDSFGLAVAKPSRNITVRGNTHLAGRGISIGSEVSGGIEHVRIKDISHLGPSEHGLHIKTSPTRGAYVRDVAYDNITIGNVVDDFVISLTTSYGGSHGSPPASALTEITGVSYSNIRRGGSTIHDTGAGEWECFPKRPCTNFSMLEVGARFTPAPISQRQALKRAVDADRHRPGQELEVLEPRKSEHAGGGGAAEQGPRRLLPRGALKSLARARGLG